MVQQLSDDFLSGVGNAYPVIEAGGDCPVTPTSKNLLDGEVESPDLFKRGNYYCEDSHSPSHFARTLTEHPQTWLESAYARSVLA
jgi:hypothetical protein